MESSGKLPASVGNRASGVSLNELSRVLQITQFQGDIYIFFFFNKKAKPFALHLAGFLVWK